MVVYLQCISLQLFCRLDQGKIEKKTEKPVSLEYTKQIKVFPGNHEYYTEKEQQQPSEAVEQ